MPQYEDIEAKLLEIAAILNGELGLPATHMGTLPPGHLSKHAFLRITAESRARIIAGHQHQAAVRQQLAGPATRWV